VESPIFEVLDDATRLAVLSAARRRSFGAGEVIFHEGDPADSFFVIDSGLVAIRSSTPLGDIATFTVLGPGEFFGEVALVTAEKLRTASAIAKTATRTISLHRDDLETLRTEHPAVTELLLTALAGHIARLSSQLVDAYYVPVNKRIYRRLLQIAEVVGPGGGTVVLPLTQDDLAGMAGTTRQTVNLALGAAETDGLLTRERGKITLLDRALLARRAR
jgi:CRP/FNR family transcriptional regulator, cyclic AMP receptor protein